MVLKRKLAPQGMQGSRNPEGKARGEQIAQKLHLANADDRAGVSLTMDCWDCQIKPHLATQSVGTAGGRHIRASFDYDIDLLYSQSSPPLPPWGGEGGRAAI